MLLLQLELCLAQLSGKPCTHWLKFAASSQLLPLLMLEHGHGAASKRKGSGRRLFTLSFFWQGSSSSKDKAASCSPAWGCARWQGSQGWAGRAGAAGAAAGRDGGEEAETESCVALSAADVYCTGWAGWKGGRLERGPVPPAAQLQDTGLVHGPSLAVAAYIQCGRLQSARQRGIRARTHTHTSRIHTHLHACL